MWTLKSWQATASQRPPGCQEIEYVCCLHEQACAFAAEAYAEYTNNLGVALVTTGPGGTNKASGALSLWRLAVFSAQNRPIPALDPESAIARARAICQLLPLRVSGM